MLYSLNFFEPSTYGARKRLALHPGRRKVYEYSLGRGKMLITVAICTYNRAESLRRTLDSLVAMRVPGGLDWEGVVVNNNCTDHTDAVIASFADRAPIRREFEPRQGLSNARNRAVNAARGDYIVWTDDDVTADPGWLAAYAEAFRRWPEASVFGGPVIPQYEEPAAKWVVEGETLLAIVYSLRDFGEKPLPLSVPDRRTPIGANFAVRTLDQRAVLYDPKLGFSAGQLMGGDELDVIHRILNSGATGRWVPTARVRHCIGHDRQTIGYVVRRLASMGEEAALLDIRWDGALAFQGGGHGPVWFGVPRWVWRQLVESWLKFQLHRRISPATIWLRYLRDYSMAYGRIRHLRSESRP